MKIKGWILTTNEIEEYNTDEPEDAEYIPNIAVEFPENIRRYQQDNYCKIMWHNMCSASTSDD